MAEFNLVLLGAPGSGKGTLASKLSKKFNIPHISTGDLIREEIAKKSELGQKIEKTVKSGKLVSNEIVMKLLFSRLEEKDAVNGFILDGFPRNIEQAKALEERLAEKGKKISTVLFLDVPKEEIMRRISGRRQCEKCGAIYNVYSNPPKVEGKCDLCSGKLFIRKDDRPGIVEERWKVFVSSTEPLVKFYEEKGLLKKVEMLGSVEENFKKALNALEAVE